MTSSFSRAMYGAAIAIWIFAVINLIAQPAYAYVDPGSGLLALQIIGSTIVGATFLIRKRIRQMLSFFSRKQREATKPVER